MATRTRRATGGSSRHSTTEDNAGRLNRDYGDEEYREPGEGYQGPTPKKGLYPAKLVSINDHVAQNGEGNESVRWGFELTGGTSPTDDGDEASVVGFRDYQYTNDNTTLWREQQIAVALGLVKPNGKLNATYAAILKKAKPCTVRIIRERYVPEDGGDPEWRAKIAAVLKARDEVVGKSRRKAAEPDEDAFDDEDEEEGDEDEEEAPPTRSRRTTSRSRRKAAEPEPEDEDEDEEELEDEDEDEEGDEEDIDPDALAAELEDLSLVALKKRARDDFGVKITRGMKADAIIDAVIATLDEDEDEDDEEEPPPPPKRAAKGSTRTTARKRGSSTPPPF